MLNNQPSQIAPATATTSGSYAARRRRNQRTALTPSSPGRTTPATMPGTRRFSSEVQLIRNWLAVIRQCSMVTAHGTLGGQLPTSEELLHLLDTVEEAVATRIKKGPTLLNALDAWQASLLHWEPGIAPENCLVCERARAIPDELPIDYAWALRVLDEAS